MKNMSYIEARRKLFEMEKQLAQLADNIGLGNAAEHGAAIKAAIVLQDFREGVTE